MKQHNIAVDSLELATAVAAAEPLVATALLPAGEALVPKGYKYHVCLHSV